MMLSVEEVAGVFDVHPETVRRWIRGGELKFSRRGKGGQLLIAPDDARAFAARTGAHTFKPIPGSDVDEERRD